MTNFDKAYVQTIKLLEERFPKSREDIYVVRDTTGTIVVVLDDNALSKDGCGSLARELHSSLGRYSDGENRVLLRRSDLIDAEDILNSVDKVATTSPNIWLIDRTLTNQDWIRPTLRTIPRIPTAVAYSVKGGVGRSTALAVAAWHLARLGRHVLVIDLDLEAPGIGTMLLQNPPQTGLVDWLVEQLNGRPDRALLQSAIGESAVNSATDGSVRVLAAYGTETKNFISKIGRIYAPSVSENGKILGLAERLDELLNEVLLLDNAPEVVLIDSRAGMHDIGSAVVTRLGAEVFLFARNDPQDWWAYGEIFDHLRLSASVAKGMGDDNDLRWKLKMVAAQTLPRDDFRRKWINDSYEAWAKFYDSEADGSVDFQPEVFDRDAKEAPHFPLFVNFELAFRSLPLNQPDALPDWEFARGIFGDFIDGLERQLFPNET